MTPHDVGTALLHWLLDAHLSGEPERIRAAHRELVEHVEAVRLSQLDERGHHPSFTAVERRWFYASLRAVCARTGMDAKRCEDLAASVFGARPSGMRDRYARAELLRWLEEPEGIKAYADAEEARLSAMVRELVPVQCEQCGKTSRTERCQSCGWRHKQEAA